MSVKYILFAILSFLLFGSGPQDQFPQAEIANGFIRVRLYLPDSKLGYYHGTRFDWSGVMPELDFQGHTYFGKWYAEEHDPTFHDHIAGPVEEFTPIGYEEAKTGETFLKIGVGILVKPEEAKYSFVTPYKNINSGTWKVKKKKDQVEFIQVLDDKEYAYQYKKTVLLIKGKPEMVLSHSLKNTGMKEIETSVYNHNFFVIDKQPIGPDFDVTFPFTLSSETPVSGSFGKLQDNKILFEKELINNDHLFFRSLTGFSNSAKDYDIKIENHKTGAAVRITSDQPLSRIVFWSAPKTVCPEPYIKFNIKPGETVKWEIVYQFYTRQDVK